MLRELRIKNLALIDEATLRFDPGFSVFTGETGAGKSILLGAIGLILGDRASAESVRTGHDEAEVCAVFEPKANRRLDALLDELGISRSEDTLIIRRTVTRTDRNRIFVNDTPATLAGIRRIGDLLVDFHSQHDHQSLMLPEAPYEIVDALPGTAQPRQAYAGTYDAFVKAQSALDDHIARARELSARRDLLEFQYNELHLMQLKPGEEQELAGELAMLSSTGDRISCVQAIGEALGIDGDPCSARLTNAKKKLEALAKFDQSALPLVSDADTAIGIARELERFASSYADALSADADPGRVDAVNERLAKIQKLRKKYGVDHPGLVAREQSLKADLASLANVESDASLLTAARDSARTACLDSGSRLSAARKKACADFDRRITKVMKTLGIDGGWHTEVSPLQEPSPSGTDGISFMVQTNPGEPFLPLVKIASGGELSRLMLAVKSVLSAHDAIPLLVFDEIDTGIGGMIAGEVAGALMGLSRLHQVFCISHLHQIASRADSHYAVYKEQDGSRTVTRAKKLTDAERVDEVARMLGGESEITRKHARELLKGG